MLPFRVLFAALIGALALVNSTAAQAERLPQNVDALLSSIVSVLPEWPRGSYNATEPEGSGVVVLDGTVIVTANHVVERALSVRIRTSSGEILEATVAGTDKASDLAILKLNEPLPPVALAGDVEIGEVVCAIGNAFGLGLSVTCGSVSAVHRSGVGFNAVEDFVQTDAAVNPGASGGALVRSDGSLVGILSAIFTKNSDANIGVNFAVAAPLAARVIDELSATGRVGWNFGGAGVAQHPPRGATGEMAALVVQVRPGGDAEAAGLAAGDRIVRAGGWRIRSPEAFRGFLGRMRPGDDTVLEIRRDGSLMQLPFTMR